MNTLTPTETARRAELHAAHEANRAAWNRITKAPHTCATPEQAAQIDAEAPFTNQLRAELETLNFRADAPEPTFCYPCPALERAPKWAFAPGLGGYTLTGFMGNELVRITELGAEFTSGFGDKRRMVRGRGINGAAYSGMIYGTYARVRPVRHDVLTRS